MKFSRYLWSMSEKWSASEKRIPATVIAAPGTPALLFEVSTEPLEQTYKRMRILKEIREALEEFSPRQRRRFLLHFIYGYTYLEIAKMEGSNKSTVMRSARATLKKNQKKLAA